MFKKRKSVSLTEILVGAVILALVFGGLLASFLAARGYVTRANKRLVVGNFIRRAFSSLYNAVRADKWEDAGSAIYAADVNWRDHNFNEVNLDLSSALDSVVYQGDYQVRNVAGRDYREARINLQYPSD